MPRKGRHPPSPRDQRGDKLTVYFGGPMTAAIAEAATQLGVNRGDLVKSIMAHALRLCGELPWTADGLALAYRRSQGGQALAGSPATRPNSDQRMATDLVSTGFSSEGIKEFLERGRRAQEAAVEAGALRMRDPGESAVVGPADELTEIAAAWGALAGSLVTRPSPSDEEAMRQAISEAVEAEDPLRVAGELQKAVDLSAEQIAGALLGVDPAAAGPDRSVSILVEKPAVAGLPPIGGEAHLGWISEELRLFLERLFQGHSWEPLSQAVVRVHDVQRFCLVGAPAAYRLLEQLEAAGLLERVADAWRLKPPTGRG